MKGGLFVWHLRSCSNFLFGKRELFNKKEHLHLANQTESFKAPTPLEILIRNVWRTTSIKIESGTSTGFRSKDDDGGLSLACQVNINFRICLLLWLCQAASRIGALE